MRMSIKAMVTIRLQPYQQTAAALDRTKRAFEQAGDVGIGQAVVMQRADGRNRDAHPVPWHDFQVSSPGGPFGTHVRCGTCPGRSRSATQSERLLKAPM